MKRALFVYIVIFICFICSDCFAITFGIEYLNPREKIFDYDKQLKIFSSIGISRVKVQEIVWEAIEPEPPKKGVHQYRWDVLDGIVRLAQQHGYKEIEIVVEARSSWAGRSFSKEEKKGMFGYQQKSQSLIVMPPDGKENMKNYHNFIYRMVERYDGDSVDDMPKLKYPVLDYEIETEAQGTYHWRGNTSEYAKLLQTAYRAAKKANPNVRIIIAGFTFGDVLDPHVRVEKRIEKVNPKLGKRQNWVNFIKYTREILKEKDYFDEIEFHAIPLYLSMYPTVHWLRKEMKKLGYEKPIFAGDANSAPLFASGPVRAYPTPFIRNWRGVVKILANKEHRKFKEVNAWYRAEQSRETVRKTIAALELGLKKINFCYFSDHPAAYTPQGKKFAAKNPWFYNWNISGFLDPNNQPYPAFYTYKIVVDKLTDAKFIKRLRIREGVHGFELSKDDKPIYVLWSDKEASILFAVSPSFRFLRITNIITEFNKQNPRVEEMQLKLGEAELKLRNNPIFVEPLIK